MKTFKIKPKCFMLDKKSLNSIKEPKTKYYDNTYDDDGLKVMTAKMKRRLSDGDEVKASNDDGDTTEDGVNQGEGLMMKS